MREMEYTIEQLHKLNSEVDPEMLYKTLDDIMFEYSHSKMVDTESSGARLDHANNLFFIRLLRDILGKPAKHEN